MATATKTRLKIFPLADRVAIRPLEETEEMKGGLYIPDTAKEKPIQGEVIAVGPGRLEKGQRIRSEERRVGKECRSRCDWSSDVCSSDLGDERWPLHPGHGQGKADPGRGDRGRARPAGKRPADQIGRASCRERV